MRLLRQILILIIVINAVAIKAQLSIEGVVKHAATTSTANTGNITLNVSGGTAPYTYSWSPGGSASATLSSAARNNYTVTVNDAGTLTAVYPYSLGYKTNWKDLYGMLFRNDTMFSGYAVSKNTLLANTDGWVEFVAGSGSSDFTIGFTDSLSPVAYNLNDIDFGVNLNAGQIRYLINGYAWTVSTQNGNDVIRIERVDTMFNIKQNGVIVYSTPMPKNKNFKIKSITSSVLQANIGSSFLDSANIYFANYVKDVAVIKHCTPGSNNGSISLTPAPGETAHTYSWSPGSYTTSAISSLSVSAYTANVKDADINRSKQKYNVGYKTYWKNVYGMIFRNDTMLSGYAISKNTLPANIDGWAEFVVGVDNSDFTIGFIDSLSPLPLAFDNIDFGVNLNSGQLRYIIDGYPWVVSLQKTGDVIRIEREDTMFNIKQNGAIVFSYPMQKNKNFKLKSITSAISQANIGTSFIDTTNINFINYVKDVAVIKHCTPGSNNGSISLTPAPGETAHTYTWSPGSYTTSSISSLSVSAYTANVKDADLNTSTQVYNVGYKTVWKDQAGMIFRNDSLLAGIAVSKNTLLANTNGWAEFVLGTTTGDFIIGFTDSLSCIPARLSDIDFGVNVSYGVIYYHVGDYSSYISSQNVGDIIRIERADTMFNIKQNGATVYSYRMPKNKNFKLKAIVYSGSKSNIGASFIDSAEIAFPNYVRNIPYIKHSSGAFINDGSIELFPKPGDAQHTYTWTATEENSSKIESRNFGTYNVTIADTLLNTSNYNYDILYKAKWTNLDSCIFRNDSLKNIYGYAGWSTASSKNVLRANKNGEINWVVDNISSYRMLGFVDTLSGISGDTYNIDQGVYLADANLYYWNNGFYYYWSTVAPGDIIKMKRSADTISFFLNNEFLASTIVTNANVDWVVKAVMYPGHSISNIGCSFNSPSNLIVIKEHADYDNLKNGFAYIKQESGLAPRTIMWSDGLINDSRNDLTPGIHIVSIMNADGSADDKEVSIGVKPNWSIKQNSIYQPDSIIKIDTLIKGVLVSHNISYDKQSAWFENKVINKNTDFVFGFIATDKTNIDSNYMPPVFPSAILDDQIILAQQLYNKAIHDSLTYASDGLNIGSSAEKLFLVRVHNGKISSLMHGASDSLYDFNNGDILKIGRTLSGTLYFSVNDSIIFSNYTNISNKYLVSSIITNSKKINITQTGIYTNTLFQNLTYLTNPNPVCNGDLCRTWATTTTFDENGNVVSVGKQFFDQFGRPTQSQQKTMSNNNVLASETVYDAFGRATGNTLIAPTYQNNLCYKNDFFAHHNGVGHYLINDFDAASTKNNPRAVGNQNKGQLGWYYSNNNNEEYSVPADSLPYSRVEYSDDPLGRVVKQSGVGENHRMGSGHEVSTLYENSGLELNQVFPKFSNELKDDFTLKKYTSTDVNSNLKNIHKTTSINQDGKLSFTFTDNFGKVAATCVEGGDSVACDNGYGINESLSVSSFVQVHVPKEMHGTLKLITDAAPGVGVYPIIKWANNPSVTLYGGGGGDYTYYPSSGKIIFSSLYQQGDVDILISFGSANTFPSGKTVSFVSKLNYTQWTLYYYDVKGRLKAIQSPYDVYCSPKVVNKMVVDTNEAAFNCNSSKAIAISELRISDGGSMVSPQTAKISFKPEFKFADTLLTDNAGGLIFETHDRSKQDTTGNYISAYTPTFVAVLSDTVEYVYRDTITDTLVRFKNKDPKEDLYGKEIRYTGSYLVGIKKTDNSISYFTDSLVYFDYTLKLDGENSRFIDNSFMGETGFTVPEDSLDKSKEILIKNVDLKMTLKGFQGISPIKEFSPCDQDVYIDSANAAIIQLVTSNISFKSILVTTLPPANTPPTTPQFSKKFWYNEYDHVIATETKDEGITYFLNDLKENKLRYTQNAKQRPDGKFSYINYDQAGRIIETGEYDPALSEPSVSGDDGPYTPPEYIFLPYYSTLGVTSGQQSCLALAATDLDIFAASQRKTQQSYLSYDLINSPPNSPGFIYAYAKVSKAWNATSATWYEYNERGQLVKSVQDLQTLGVKTFDYAYDWRGKLLNNIADQGATEEFKHSYQYDADERLIKTSALKGVTSFDINKLSYYQHGALRRNEIGNKLQGLDYIYTIAGALKSMNNPFAGIAGEDPGYDGTTGGPNPLVEPDAFAYTLEYYPGDYNRSQSEVNLANAASNFNNENISYAGQVQSVRWKTQLPTSATNNFGTDVLMYEYNYDNLYRLKAAKFGTVNAVSPTCMGCQGTAVNNPTSDYGLEDITYDLNGNIQTLKRYSEAISPGNPQIMDDLYYTYDVSNNKNNQLLRVIDYQTTTLSLTDEIDLPHQTATTNYNYNAIGELNYSVKDNHTYSYYYTGLVKEVKDKTTNDLIVSYEYNHLNLRQCKTTYASGVAAEKLFYVYNESGMLTSTYKQSLATTPAPAPALIEHIIYGNGKAGIYDVTASKPFFELTDHVGNVRAVISENSGSLLVDEYTDYFPHGGILPGRQYVSALGYRYAYQGQEKDQETKLTNFELRQYDPRIGRWNNPDPYGQHHSPYLAMSNNPVSFVDRNGGQDEKGNEIWASFASMDINGILERRNQQSQREANLQMYENLSMTDDIDYKQAIAEQKHERVREKQSVDNVDKLMEKSGHIFEDGEWVSSYKSWGKFIYGNAGTEDDYAEGGVHTYYRDEVLAHYGLSGGGWRNQRGYVQGWNMKELDAYGKNLVKFGDAAVVTTGAVAATILTAGVALEAAPYIAAGYEGVSSAYLETSVVSNYIGRQIALKAYDNVTRAAITNIGSVLIKYLPRAAVNTPAFYRLFDYLVKNEAKVRSLTQEKIKDLYENYENMKDFYDSR